MVRERPGAASSGVGMLFAGARLPMNLKLLPVTVQVMAKKTHEPIEGIDDEERRLIETARWHTLRYDNLRVSLASRASFVLSADAVLIAGVSFLFSWFSGRTVYGGKSSIVLVGGGMLVALISALLSMRRASQALLSSKPWRVLFNVEPPRSLFYQHSDTVKAVPTYAEFRAAFEGQTASSELESAMVNLWLVLHTHAYRYGFLRVANQRAPGCHTGVCEHGRHCRHARVV